MKLVSDVALLKMLCPDCCGEGVIECENCEGAGNCYCSKCEVEHDCGCCDGIGNYNCETCKGSGSILWTGKEKIPEQELAEDAVCSCGRIAEAIVGKEGKCSLCEAEWVYEKINNS